MFTKQNITSGDKSINVQAIQSEIKIYVNQELQEKTIKFSGNEISSAMSLIEIFISNGINPKILVNGLHIPTQTVSSDLLLAIGVKSDLYIRQINAVSIKNGEPYSIGGSNASKQTYAAYSIELFFNLDNFSEIASKKENYWLMAYEPKLYKNLILQLIKNASLTKENARIISLMISRTLDISHTKQTIENLPNVVQKIDGEIIHMIVESTRTFENTEIAIALLRMLEQSYHQIDAKTMILGIESIGANSSYQDQKTLLDVQKYALMSLDRFENKEVEHLIWCILSICKTHQIKPQKDIVNLLKRNSFEVIPHNLLENFY